MSPKPVKRVRETNPAALRSAITRRLPRHLRAAGEVALPAVPALLDHYVQLLTTLFATLGRDVNESEKPRFRAALSRALEQAFAVSPFAKVLVAYKTLPHRQVGFRFTVQASSMADQYANWVETRSPPLFGSQPDAKPMQLAGTLGTPAEVAVLDVGAGTGRNSIAFAKAGYPTDALDLAPSLTGILRDEVAKLGLHNLRVFDGVIFDATLPLPLAHYRLMVVAEVTSHFRGASELRRLFEAAQRLLAPGGLLILSVFLSSDGYKPDEAAREFSQVAWSTLFTRRELEEATATLGLVRVSDDSVLEFERANQPEAAWPPTGWFSEWAGGQDLFDLPEGRPPVELRWLVYRTQAAP